ncbi:hypothetical protein S245_065276, partial [Arachis hypogaea]
SPGHYNSCPVAKERHVLDTCHQAGHVLILCSYIPQRDSINGACSSNHLHQQKVFAITYQKNTTLFQEQESMASHDQSFKAGEAKGQTQDNRFSFFGRDYQLLMVQEKTNQMMRNIGDKAQSAKDKTAQTAQAAKDKTQQAAQAAKERTTGDNVKIFVNGDTCGSLT